MPSSSPTLSGQESSAGPPQGQPRGRGKLPGQARRLWSGTEPPQRPQPSCSWIQVRAHGGCAVHNMQGAQGATVGRAAARLLGHAGDTARQEVSRTIHVPAQRSHPTRPHTGSPGSGSAPSNPGLIGYTNCPPLARENRSRQNPSGEKGNPHPAVYP